MCVQYRAARTVSHQPAVCCEHAEVVWIYTPRFGQIREQAVARSHGGRHRRIPEKQECACKPADLFVVHQSLLEMDPRRRPTQRNPALPNTVRTEVAPRLLAPTYKHPLARDNTAEIEQLRRELNATKHTLAHMTDKIILLVNACWVYCATFCTEYATHRCSTSRQRQESPDSSLSSS